MERLRRLPLENNLVEPVQMKVTERQAREVSLHWHEFYEIELYRAGEGTTHINGQAYPIRPNTLAMLTPVDFHDLRSETGLELISITFSPDWLEESPGALTVPAGFLVTELDNRQAERLAGLMNWIREEYTAGRPGCRAYAGSLLRCMLLELLRLEHRGGGEPALPVQRAVYYLRSHFREPIGLMEAAAFGGVSPSHMSKLFRANMGMGLKEYLTELRLNHAEQLLRLTGESVTNVAESCGFGTISHFLHVFREHYGLSPLQYRKAVLQNGEKQDTI